ncbi:MAG: alkaline phosphatase family protein [Candidatus Lokiarchaeota archaeon]|nr:alkaline phosphatase family protein [Candidatus Lokiarchaeota archaeon]
MDKVAKHVILLVADDVSGRLFSRLYNEGKLPNLKLLGDKGIICDKCVTSYPSITLPTQPNLMTGAYSGYYPKSGSGIPVYHWFDREANPPQYRHYSALHALRQTHEIEDKVKTLFEQIGEGNSYSIVQYCSRGVTKVFPPNKFIAAIFFLFAIVLSKKPENSHKIVTKRLIDVFKNPKRFFGNSKLPKAVTALYFLTDSLMHEYGFDSERYLQSVLDLDVEVGKVIDALQKLGIYDDTIIVFTSDHGNYKAEKAKDLEPFIKSKGLVPFSKKTGKGDFDCSFGSVGFFNFPGTNKNWKLHPTLDELKHFKPTNSQEEINLIEMMFEIEGVKYVYYRGNKNTPENGTIHIRMKDENGNIHNAQIDYNGDTTRYSFEDMDVYRYSEDSNASKLLDGNFHTIEEWLKYTYSVDFPMIPDQLMRYFINPRSCDIMVSTVGTVCYNYEHGETKNDHVYSHDIGLRESMHVPLVIGGSETLLTPRKLEYCKTTDIVPTLVKLLGKEPHPSVKGKSLVN